MTPGPFVCLAGRSLLHSPKPDICLRQSGMSIFFGQFFFLVWEGVSCIHRSFIYFKARPLLLIITFWGTPHALFPPIVRTATPFFSCSVHACFRISDHFPPVTQYVVSIMVFETSSRALSRHQPFLSPGIISLNAPRNTMVSCVSYYGFMPLIYNGC